MSVEVILLLPCIVQNCCMSEFQLYHGDNKLH